VQENGFLCKILPIRATRFVKTQQFRTFAL